MWNAIGLVTGGFSLAAFIVAVAYWAYRRRLIATEKQVESAPEDSRPRVIEAFLSTIHVDTRGLSRDQRYRLALKLLATRTRESRQKSLLVAFLGLILGGITAIALWHPKEAPSPPEPKTPSVEPLVSDNSASTSDAASENRVETKPAFSKTPSSSLLPFHDVYLSKALEVPGHNFQNIEYRPVTSIAGKTYVRGLFLDSQNAGPSSVSYQIPPEAKLFVATAIARDAGGCGSGSVNGWTVTITTSQTKAAADLSWNYLDPVVLRVPVDNIPADGIRELTITVNPHSDRTCDHSALGDPHFTGKKEAGK